MLKISPKLIDVDGNRIKVIGRIPQGGNRTCNFGEEIYRSGGNGSPRYLVHKSGRFPTQLFTSIKNDKFKYVKNIDLG